MEGQARGALTVDVIHSESSNRLLQLARELAFLGVVLDMRRSKR